MNPLEQVNLIPTLATPFEGENTEYSSTQKFPVEGIKQSPKMNIPLTPGERLPEKNSSSLALSPPPSSSSSAPSLSLSPPPSPSSSSSPSPSLEFLGSHETPKISSLLQKVQLKSRKSVFNRFGNQSNFITKQMQQASTPAKSKKSVHKAPRSKSLKKRRSIFEKPESTNNTEHDYETWKRNRTKKVDNKCNQRKSLGGWKKIGQHQQSNVALCKYQKLLKKNSTARATAQKIAAEKTKELEKMKEIITSREALLDEKLSKSQSFINATSETIAANRAEEMRKMKEAVRIREESIEKMNHSTPHKANNTKSESSPNEKGNSQWKKYVVVVDEAKKNSPLSSRISISSRASISSYTSIGCENANNATSEPGASNSQWKKHLLGFGEPGGTSSKTSSRNSSRNSSRTNSFSSLASIERNNRKGSTAQKIAINKKEELRKMNEVIASREIFLKANLSKPNTSATAGTVSANKAEELRKMREAMKKREESFEPVKSYSLIGKKAESKSLFQNDSNSQWRKHVIVFDQPKKINSISSPVLIEHETNEKRSIFRDHECTKNEKTVVNETEMQKRKQTQGEIIMLQDQQCPKSTNVGDESKMQKGKDVLNNNKVLFKKENHPKSPNISNSNSESKVLQEKKNFQPKKKEENVMFDEPKKFHPILPLTSFVCDENVGPIINSTAKKIAADRKNEMRKMKEALRRRETILEKNSQIPQNTSKRTPFYKMCSTANLIAIQREEEMRKMREAVRKREVALDKMNQSNRQNYSTVGHTKDLFQEQSNSQWKKHVICLEPKKTFEPEKSLKPGKSIGLKNSNKNIIKSQDCVADDLSQMRIEEKRLSKYLKF